MEGADPHSTRVDRNHVLQASQHFFSGLIGEGHRKNLARMSHILLKQVGNAAC